MVRWLAELLHGQTGRGVIARNGNSNGNGNGNTERGDMNTNAIDAATPWQAASLRSTV